MSTLEMSKNTDRPIAKQSSKNRKKLILQILIFLLFLSVSLIIIIPFYILVISSFKPGNDLMRYGINLAIEPEKMSLNNFRLLFSGTTQYFTWFFNFRNI